VRRRGRASAVALGRLVSIVRVSSARLNAARQRRGDAAKTEALHGTGCRPRLRRRSAENGQLPRCPPRSAGAAAPIRAACFVEPAASRGASAQPKG